jgi:glycosyltransferase involved in cell wall biosynthesis
VLNLFTIMNRGGAETMVMNYYRNMDRTKVQYDFMVHRQERGTYDDEIEALGGRIYRMPPVRPWTSPVYRRQIRQFYQTHTEYKIIHSHMSELGYYDFLEAEKTCVPVRICHAHNRPHGWNFKSPVRRYYKKRMMPHITHMFMCGEEAGEWLFGRKNRDKFIQLNNAIDAERYSYNEKRRQEVRKKLDISTQLVVGHIGRFDTQKNHTFLIDVFYQIWKKQSDTVLLLVGDDSRDGGKKIHHKVCQMGMEKQVRFLGIRSDVPDLLQAMDVFVFPSLFEGLSLASIEAQAAGLPCIISDKIPIECKKTDLVRVVSLNDTAEKWADTVVEAAKSDRKDTYEEIKAAGFDIVENAKQLERFYIKNWKQLNANWKNEEN